MVSFARTKLSIFRICLDSGFRRDEVHRCARHSESYIQIHNSTLRLFAFRCVFTLIIRIGATLG